MNLKSIKKAGRQLIAFTEKDFLLEIRYKANFIIKYLNPLVQLLVFFFIFGALFYSQSNYKLGYWNSTNFALFLILAYCIQQSKSIIDKYRQMFLNEKYWRTLSGIMIAPVNLTTLLIGILFSELIMISIPFIFLIILALILFPISLITIILVFLVFLAIFVIFSSIGLLVGVFSISNEELVPYSTFALRILFLFSCINYPIEIFPSIIQFFILLNPFYYMFDLLRLVWYIGMDNLNLIHLITPIHLLSLIIILVIIPILSLKLFKRIYKKYGITGY